MVVVAGVLAELVHFLNVVVKFCYHERDVGLRF